MKNIIIISLLTVSVIMTTTEINATESFPIGSITDMNSSVAAVQTEINILRNKDASLADRYQYKIDKICSSQISPTSIEYIKKTIQYIAEENPIIISRTSQCGGHNESLPQSTHESGARYKANAKEAILKSDASVDPSSINIYHEERPGAHKVFHFFVNMWRAYDASCSYKHLPNHLGACNNIKGTETSHAINLKSLGDAFSGLKSKGEDMFTRMQQDEQNVRAARMRAAQETQASRV